MDEAEFNASERIAESIVDALEREFEPDHVIGEMDWDHDTARQIIAAYIPRDKAEAEEEFDRILNSEPDPTVVVQRKSMFSRLRKAVHATDGMSIMCVIEAAVKRLEVK